HRHQQQDYSGHVHGGRDRRDRGARAAIGRDQLRSRGPGRRGHHLPLSDVQPAASADHHPSRFGGLPREGQVRVMPLATRNVFVPLGTGVRRDIDEHVLPVGSTSVVFNGVYNHLGELVKRPGSTLLTMGITPGASSVANTWQLATHKNSLVNLERAPTIQPIEVYSPAKGQWAAPPAPGVGGTTAPGGDGKDFGS